MRSTIIKTIVCILYVLFSNGCSQERLHLEGEWVNLKYNSLKPEVIFNFKENEVFQTTEGNKIKISKWRFNGDELLIENKDGMFDKYEFRKLNINTIELFNNSDRTVLIRKEFLPYVTNFELKNVKTNLITEPWEINVFNEDSAKLEVEFLSSNKLLFNHSITDSRYQIRSIDWKLSKIGSLSFLTLYDMFQTNILITNYENNYIKGLVLEQDKLIESTILKQSSNQNALQTTRKLLNGEWINIDAESKKTYSLAFYFNGYLNEYSRFDHEFGKNISGPFQLSSDGKLILLDRLKHYNESILQINRLSNDTIVLKLGFDKNSEVTFKKNHDAILFD